jgi:hypothetical protein
LLWNYIDLIFLNYYGNCAPNWDGKKRQ